MTGWALPWGVQAGASALSAWRTGCVPLGYKKECVASTVLPWVTSHKLP